MQHFVDIYPPDNHHLEIKSDTSNDQKLISDVNNQFSDDPEVTISIPSKVGNSDFRHSTRESHRPVRIDYKIRGTPEWSNVILPTPTINCYDNLALISPTTADNIAYEIENNDVIFALMIQNSNYFEIYHQII